MYKNHLKSCVWGEETILNRCDPIIPFSPTLGQSPAKILLMLENCAFQGKELATAYRVWSNMIQNDVLKVMTLSGAMVPAGMGEIIMQLIEHKFIDILVSTGANVTHDLLNALSDGEGHFQVCPEMNDIELSDKRVNRIYDVLLPESYYENLEKWLFPIMDELAVNNEAITPSYLHNNIGEKLFKEDKRCILSVAYKNNVPIFCGAFSDSELALDMAKFKRERGLTLYIDDVRDINIFSDCMMNNIANPPIGEGREAGIIICGGGVPRNWAQQIFPYLDMIDSDVDKIGYKYAIRVCTDSFPGYGNLSSCTESEGETWHKYLPGAAKAEVSCDITIALPLLASALIEEHG